MPVFNCLKSIFISKIPKTPDIYSHHQEDTFDVIHDKVDVQEEPFDV